MTSLQDKIVQGFPYPTLDCIVGIPTYETISELHSQLNAISASVQSNLGGGAHGHLTLTVKPSVYNTLSATPFIAPVNPGAAQLSLLDQLRHNNSKMTQPSSTNTQSPTKP